MNHKYLSYAGLKRFFYTKILKQINLKIDKTNGDISNTKVRSVDTISTEFPDPVVGESTKTFLGKVKKCLADWKAIKSTLLTLSMLTNQYENSTSKIPTVALVYALKQTTDTINSNLDLKANASDLTWKSLFNGDITISNGTNITITSGTIGSYKEFVISSGAGASSEWTRSYFSNAGIPFVINDVVSGTGIVNNNIVPISLKVASSTVFTALLGNNVRIRSIHGR